jgi:hypothetical protein
MKHMKKLAGLAATLTLLGLASAPASAVPVNFTFTGGGSINSVSSCGVSCYLLHTSGIAVETGGLSGFNAWDFDGVMRFESLTDPTGNGSSPGLGWYFDDLTGGNDLWGTFTSTMDAGFRLFDWLLDGAVGSGTLNYTVTGGSGRFEDVTGQGASRIGYAGLFYIENGWMTADAKQVPEPGTLTLLGVALSAMGLGAWRRRRTAAQS